MANTELSKSKRLDQYVVERFPQLSRAYAVRLIEHGRVTVNGQTEKPGYKLRRTDQVEIDFDPSELDAIPDIELPVLYEDDDVVVVDKPSGVISHARGRYWDEPSVASFIRSRFSARAFDADNPAGATRAGIVHRLDRATSGVMICAKNPDALKVLQRQFGERSVKKVYRAVVVGQPEPLEAIIDMPIGRNPAAPSTFRIDAAGKYAITHYKTLSYENGRAQLELTPQTGRTHQLRVHLQQIGHPIVGDVLYGGTQAERLYLHAWRLEITLPSGERKTFEAPIPAVFGDEEQPCA
ncbi:RNA pseudouridine synthase [Candidatus Saccharibacteria bacterium]|nr:MAG: RNA pseudouridine synthase [Candidatus Saccharibacteria bacterium]